MKTTEIHVTRVVGDDVYGHTTDHCDANGCNGFACYWPEVSALAHDVQSGQIVSFTAARGRAPGTVEVTS